MDDSKKLSTPSYDLFGGAPGLPRGGTCSWATATARRFVRYTFVPMAGVQHLDADTRARLPGTDHGQDEQRVFEIWAQLANGGDVTDDATVRWPEDERVLLGIVAVDRVAEHNALGKKKIIFDPVPRIEGNEPSADPMFDVGAAVYLVSGKRRRAES